MLSSREGRSGPVRVSGRRLLALSGLIVGGLLPSIGCQVEYAGMTLPSGKYMRDDVQYFEPGTNFPWANTQAATQRARLQAAGELPIGAGIPGQVGPGAVPIAPGAVNPLQNQMGRPTDVNASPMSVDPLTPPAPDAAGAPLGEPITPPAVPAPHAAGAPHVPPPQ